MVSKITKRLLRFRNKRAKPSSEVDPATESTNVKEIPAPHLSSHHLLLLPPDSHIHMGAYTVCQCISPRNSDAVIRDSYKIKVQRSQDAEEKVPTVETKGSVASLRSCASSPRQASFDLNDALRESDISTRLPISKKDSVSIISSALKSAHSDRTPRAGLTTHKKGAAFSAQQIGQLKNIVSNAVANGAAQMAKLCEFAEDSSSDSVSSKKSKKLKAVSVDKNPQDDIESPIYTSSAENAPVTATSTEAASSAPNNTEQSAKTQDPDGSDENVVQNRGIDQQEECAMIAEPLNRDEAGVSSEVGSNVQTTSMPFEKSHEYVLDRLANKGKWYLLWIF